MRTFSKYLFMLAYMSAFATGIYAQSMSEVKNNPDFYWGEGSGVTTDEAEQKAVAQMSRSISVSIFNKTENSRENNSVMQKNIQKSISSARLQNVQIRVLQDEPDAKVFCFMSKEEVLKMFKQREERIKDLVDTGKKAEDRLQIDDALRCYYWALLLAKTSVEPVKVQFSDQEGLATSLLPVKIKSVLQLLKAEVMEGGIEGSNISTRLKFTYNDKVVSSLQYTYNDGQGIVGPVHVKDGVGEVDLVSFPANGKLHLNFETRFKNEVDPLDTELLGLFVGSGLPTFNSSVDVAVKMKGNSVKAGKQDKDKDNMATDATVIAPQPTKDRKTIAIRNAANTTTLHGAVLDVENAIKAQKPELAFSRFTPDGYKLFEKLMRETGQVTLVGKSDYEFVEADKNYIARSTRIKVKFKGGKAFMENLVYRFDKKSGKIESVAFALTKRAEDDIMNAAATWPEVSRWAILNFMEDYQTAFALKRLDYISSIFSDDAIIITGAVLKKLNENDQVFDRNKIIKFDNNPKKVVYSKHTKSEYIQRLGDIFQKRDYVHLTFENNVTKLINLPSVVSHGAAFGIEIKQRYSSSTYSDEGYLTLALDTRGEHPIIHVRLWQPDKTEMMSLQEFVSKFTN